MHQVEKSWWKIIFSCLSTHEAEAKLRAEGSSVARARKSRRAEPRNLRRQKRLAISICTNHKVPYTTDFLLTTAQMSKRPLLVRLDFNGPDEQLIEQITLPYLSYTAKWANYFLCASTNFTTIFRSPNFRRLARTSLVYCLENKIHNCRSIIFFDFSLQKRLLKLVNVRQFLCLRSIMKVFNVHVSTSYLG